MAGIPPKSRVTENRVGGMAPRANHARLLLAPLLFSVSIVLGGLASTPAYSAPASGTPASGASSDQAGFLDVYHILQRHCGACHVQGAADGPWSLNSPPSGERFPQCLSETGEARVQCATYYQLVEEPGPGIPAWIRPEEAALSEPYSQACDPELSFHIGHSLPGPLPAGECATLLDWIEAGASRPGGN